MRVCTPSDLVNRQHGALSRLMFSQNKMNVEIKIV
jgi:hypothetical protein